MANTEKKEKELCGYLEIFLGKMRDRIYVMVAKNAKQYKEMLQFLVLIYQL